MLVSSTEMVERSQKPKQPPSRGFSQLTDDARSTVSSSAPLPLFPVGINLRDRVFAAFDNPSSSLFAKVFSITIMALILYSTVIFVIETVHPIKAALSESFWMGSEVVCVSLFTVEYVMRLLTVRGKFHFLVAPMNVIDFLAIAPFYLDTIFHLGGSGSTFLRVLRLLRVFRVFKMGKYSAGMQLMATTMSKSLHTLALLSVYLAIALVVFSSMIYFAECGDPVKQADGTIIYVRAGEDGPSPYSSIPASFWWCIVTMTTVGYGDVFPTTWAGKMIASVTMLCGVLVLALPINVIGGNFVDAYVVSQKKEEVSGIPTFVSQRERAEFYEQRCAELAAVISTMKTSMDTAERILADLEDFKDTQVHKALEQLVTPP